MTEILAIISIVSLLLVVIISCISQRINIGILATATALVVATTLTDSTVKQISAFFPTELFLMIVSVTLLFGIAAENGTLDWLANQLLFRINGKPKLYPALFFLITFLLSALGPGNIAATAIVAPIAMRLAAKFKINPFLMAIMVCTGANAGAFSPVAPTGAIMSGLLKQIGLSSGHTGLVIFLAAGILQSLSAFGAWFGLRRSLSRTDKVLVKSAKLPLNTHQKITLMVMLCTIISILFFKVPLVIAMLTGSCVLGFVGSASTDMIRKLPWDTIMMVSGVSILIGLVEKLGGLELATTLLAQLGLGSILHATMALMTGVVSAYSSSSGVVMPAFMPLIPGLIAKVNMGTTTSLAIAIAVGSHMVDVSPLSTLGAMTIAAFPDATVRSTLFKKLLTWGMSMSVVAAILAYVFLDLLHLWQ